MGNWRDALPSQWLKAADFEKPGLLTIRKFGVELIGEDKRPVVWFDEVEKGLALNITNGSTIEEICGSPDPSRWVGHKIVLFKTQTDYAGKRVDCIRIRAPKNGAAVAAPPPPEPEFHATDDDVPF
jgi:hypothetical protein